MTGDGTMGITSVRQAMLVNEASLFKCAAEAYCSIKIFQCERDLADLARNV
jgi:hypothetical protein